jgi:hypothetical protein
VFRCFWRDVEHDEKVHKGKVCFTIVCEDCVLEKEKGLHLQIVCKIYISSLVTLNKLHEDAPSCGVE